MKLDLGCGIFKKEGFIGVDSRKLPGVDSVVDLTQKWPWEADSVEEVNCSHLIEHFTAPQRIHFVNELYRVMKPASKCLMVAPHWGASRAYGDLTHQWPPVSEFWFYYLSSQWRTANAPHNDEYTCNFEATWGYSLHPSILARNQEMQGFAMSFYKEACQDIVCTLTKK